MIFFYKKPNRVQFGHLGQTLVPCQEVVWHLSASPASCPSGIGRGVWGPWQGQGPGTQGHRPQVDPSPLQVRAGRERRQASKLLQDCQVVLGSHIFRGIFLLAFST